MTGTTIPGAPLLGELVGGEPFNPAGPEFATWLNDKLLRTVAVGVVTLTEDTGAVLADNGGAFFLDGWTLSLDEASILTDGWHVDVLGPGTIEPSLGEGDAVVLAAGSSARILCDGAAVFILQGGGGGGSIDLVPISAWDIGATYAVNEAVSHDGSSYVSIVDGNVGNQPDTSPAEWMLLAEKGERGEGEDGREVELQTTATHIQWRYVGDVSWTDLIALADLTGEPGGPGENGWSPVLALVSDGSRRVLQVDDWVGGEGSKPATGDYVGASGLTSDIGDAVDIRGPAGAGSGDVNTSGSVTTQRLVRYADGTGDTIEDAGYTVAGVLDVDNHTDGTTNKVFTATDKAKVDHISVTQAVNLDTIESDVAAAKAKTDHISVTQAINLDTIETDAAASKVKTDFLSITQPVDLDAIEARVNALDAVVILKGTWAANAGTFPGSGTAQAGESWIVSTGGTVDSVEFAAGDRIIAIADNASTSTYAANWFKADYTDAVQSIDGAVGAVTVGAIIAAASAKATPVDADMMAIADSAASNATKKVTWANVKATLKTYFDGLYAAASHTHTVSALSDASANARSFLQAANYAAMKTLLSLAKGDVGLGNVDNTSNATERAATATLSGKTIVDLLTEGTILEEAVAISDGASVVINPADGALRTWTLGANRTATFSGWSNGHSVTLLVADGSAFTLALTGVVWDKGTPPTLITTGYTEINIAQVAGVLRGVKCGEFAS